MKNITKSLIVIGAVAAIAIGGTIAYFSDTEQSTGNTFTAGSINLNDNLSQKKFDLTDMKPGDTVSGNFDINATSNPYWACMKATLDSTPENNRLEMELAANDLTNGTNEGELQNYLKFYIWNDRDGNGTYNGTGNNFPTDQTKDRNLVGPLSLADMAALGYMPLADKSGVSFFGPDALTAGQSYKLGYAYCFGTPSDNVYTAITCSGAGDQNVAQTDGVTGTIDFYAVQSRNNATFTCASMNSSAVVVGPNNLNGWQAYNDSYATSGGSTTSFTTEGGAPVGSGVLRLQTFGNDSRVGLYKEGLNSNLNGLQISYASKQVSATNTADGNATIRLMIDTNGDNVAEDQLMYEPYYNLQANNTLNQASITPNTWQTWSLNNTNGKFWSNNAFTYNSKGGVGAGSYASNFTIADVLAAYSSAKIVGISFSMGTYNPDQVVLIDNFIMNGTTYNFEN